MKRLIWLLPVLLAMLVTSCLKDSLDQTIVLLGTEDDVLPIERVLDSIIMKTMDSIAENNDSVYFPKGELPPDIQGEFVFYPRVWFDNNMNSGEQDSLFFKFRFGGDPEIL